MAYKINHVYYKRPVCHSCILTSTVKTKTQQVKMPAPQDLNLHYKWTFTCEYSYGALKALPLPYMTKDRLA